MTTSAPCGTYCWVKWLRQQDRPGTPAGKSLKFVVWRPFLRDMQQHLADLDARWGLGAAEARSLLAEQSPAEAEQVWTTYVTSRACGSSTAALHLSPAGTAF